VRSEEGWVDLNIKFITDAVTSFGEVCLFRRTVHPAPPTGVTCKPMLSSLLRHQRPRRVWYGGPTRSRSA
jgi:hypothetical protein